MNEQQIQAGVQRLTGVVTANLGMPDMFVQLWQLLARDGDPVSVTQLAAASDWLARHPNGEVVAIAEEFEVWRRAVRELGWAAPRAGQSRA